MALVPPTTISSKCLKELDIKISLILSDQQHVQVMNTLILVLESCVTNFVVHNIL